MRATRLAAQILLSSALVVPVVVVAAPTASAAPQVNAVADTGSGSNSGSSDSSGSSDDVNNLLCQFSTAILRILNPTSPVPTCAPPKALVAPQK